MNEVLSRSIDPNMPLEEMEFYEIVLEGFPSALHESITVRQTHYAWSRDKRRITFDETLMERFHTSDEAMKRYADLKRALVQQGFIYSDLDGLF